MNKLPDMQKSTKGFYKTLIRKVGVRNIKIPFTVAKKEGGFFDSIAKISSYCDLVPELKGINMSRISRTINNMLKNNQDFGFINLEKFARELKKSHGTNNIWIKAELTYFMKDKSPIENLDSYEPIQIIFESQLKDNKCRNFLRVKNNQMSCCPCSKEMSLLKNNVTKDEENQLKSLRGNISDILYEKIIQSGFGAHNQKSEIDILVEINPNSKKRMWIEDIVDISKKASSCPTYSTLKRPDEKYVTEISYMGAYINENYRIKTIDYNNGPKFVEDITRDCAKYLDNELDSSIIDYVIVVNNQESIHSDEIMATAVLTAGRNLK